MPFRDQKEQSNRRIQGFLPLPIFLAKILLVDQQHESCQLTNY